jgi:tRNA 2-selenouridine synthase SelU
VAREVSYAVPLESSPVLVEFQEAHLRKIAEAYGGDIRVDVLICRNAEDAFLQYLLPHSLIVVGTRKRWWPTREERLARRLQNSGHAVLLIDRKAKTNA